jgi:hypothetical protein
LFALLIVGMNLAKLSQLPSNTKMTLAVMALLLVGTSAVLVGSEQNQENRSRASGPVISLVATSSNNSYATSVSFSRPAGVVSGDVLVAHVGTYYNTLTITPPSGWTLIRRDNNSATIPFSSALYYHVAGGSEPSTYTWFTSSKTYITGGIAAYRGVNTLSPIDANSGQVNNSTAIIAPSVTTTTSQDQLLFFALSSYSGTIGAPSGMTKRWDVSYSNYVRSSMADQALSAAGPTGNRVGSSTYAYPNTGQLVALKPATVSPTATPTTIPPTPTFTPTPTPVGPTSTPTPTPIGGFGQAPVLCPQCNFISEGNVGTRLSGKDFTNAFMPSASFQGKNLSNSLFTGGDYAGSNFSNANLSNSNFNNANFTNALLTGVTTTGATFVGATWNNTTCKDGTNSNANGGTCNGHL